MYKCESCGHENKSYKDRVIGNFYSGTRQFVKACKKCNWFLFDSEQHKGTILRIWEKD